MALYAPLYKKAGAIIGEIIFADLTDSDVSGTDFLWVRPQQAGANGYPDGWPDGLRVYAVGTKYAKGASLDFGQGAADRVNGNASLVFEDGALSATVTKPVSVDPATGAVTLVPAKGADYKLTLTVATGLFKGTFTHTDTKKRNFSGILINKGANQGGFGFFLSAPSAVGGDSQRRRLARALTLWREIDNNLLNFTRFYFSPRFSSPS